VSAPRKVYVGVDAGGTRSRAMVVDEDGLELAAVNGGPGLIDPEYPERAAVAVMAVVKEAVAAVLADGDAKVMGVWAGLAGAGREEPRLAVEEALTSAGIATAVGVGTDVEAAYCDAFGDRRGILLVSGTGSMAYALDADGKVLTVGGWGTLLGDEGSGYAIGLAGLRAVARSHDDRDSDTALESRLLKAADVEVPTQLIPWVHSATKGEIAALSSLVVATAAEGDATSSRILQTALGELKLQLTTALRRLGTSPEATPVALAGGLVKPDGVLRPALASMVEELGCPLHTEVILPERGAAARARKLIAS